MDKIIETENHHLANTRVITVAGKSHWWMVKLVHRTIMRNRKLGYLRVSPHKIHITKGKTVSLQRRKLADTTLSK